MSLLTLFSPFVVPAGKESTSFHLLSVVFSYRSAMARIAVLCGLSAVQLVASSWPEEFVQRYEAHGLALLHTNDRGRLGSAHQ